MSDLQTPFGNPVAPTPDASGGWSGTPGGLDQGSGANGITNSPWTDAPVPANNGGEDSSPDVGLTVKQTPVEGSTYQGYQPLEDISKQSPSPDVSVK